MIESSTENSNNSFPLTDFMRFTWEFYFRRFTPWTSKKRYFDGKVKFDIKENFLEMSETNTKSFYRPIFTQHEKSDYVIFISQADSQSCFGTEI